MNMNITRIIVIYDKSTNNALPVFSDVIESQDNTGATSSNNILDDFNIDNTERFEVLMDHMIYTSDNSITSPTDGAYASQLDYIDSTGKLDFNFELKHPTRYSKSSNPAVIGDIETGSLLMILWCNSTGGTLGWRMFWESRLTYCDP